MVFVSGESKIIYIGCVPSIGGYNALEIILRESGRFIIKTPSGFIALSEKKVRTITVAGAIGAAAGAQHFHEYEDNPGNVQFDSADLFPQDLFNEYPINEIEIYGISSLLNLNLTGQPADAVARLKGMHAEYWISRQPLTAWNNEDLIKLLFSAYQSVPEQGLIGVTEGILTTTTKKISIPVFSPIKSSYPARRLTDKIYLYSLTDLIGYCANSAAGGNISASATLDQRLVIGVGFLPEEVEELLSPTQ